MKRVYCRCNGGDYFLGTHCPFDGWSDATAIELADAAKRIEEQGESPSIARLRAGGVTDAALERAIIIDFGSERSAFEAVAPRVYVVDGEVMPYGKLDARFL